MSECECVCECVSESERVYMRDACMFVSVQVWSELNVDIVTLLICARGKLFGAVICCCHCCPIKSIALKYWV